MSQFAILDFTAQAGSFNAYALFVAILCDSRFTDLAKYGETHSPGLCDYDDMASTFPNRCLTFLLAVARFLFRFHVPHGYEDDTGFHQCRD